MLNHVYHNDDMKFVNHPYHPFSTLVILSIPNIQPSLAANPLKPFLTILANPEMVTANAYPYYRYSLIQS